MATVKMDDAAFRARLTQAVSAAMEKGALGLVGHIRVKIGRSARVETPGSRKTRIRNAKAKGRAFAKHLYQASRPGEPPRKRTGTLQKSIAHEVHADGSSVVARIGTNVAYGRHLEFGTRRMSARPYLRPSLSEYLPSFNRVVSLEIKRRMGRSR